MAEVGGYRSPLLPPHFLIRDFQPPQLISGGQLQLCLTFFMISQKVFITQKCFNYHLKADIKTFPTSGVALLYDHY